MYVFSAQKLHETAGRKLKANAWQQRCGYTFSFLYSLFPMDAIGRGFSVSGRKRY